MDLIPSSLQHYAERLTSPETEVLAALNRETNLKVNQAQMLSGHWQGVFLQMITHLLQPKRVLEIGTFTGYTAICFAMGLPPDGHVHTIDVNEELEDFCTRYFRAAGLADKITLHIGKAATIIPSLRDVFDLVFIDADKLNYELYYDLVIDKLRPGGFILADNVLYHGEVLLPAAAQTNNARAIHAFNEKVAADERVEQVLVTIRDGLLLIRKK